MRLNPKLPVLACLLALLCLVPAGVKGENRPVLHEVQFEMLDTATINEATLYIDGRLAGLLRKAPPLVRHLTLGSHRIELLALAAGQTWRRETSIWVIAAAGPMVDILQPLKVTNSAAMPALRNVEFRLDSRSAVPGARLTIDGSFCAMAAKDRAVTLCLKTGRHTVAVHAIAAGIVYAKTLVLEVPAGTAPLACGLRPLPKS